MLFRQHGQSLTVHTPAKLNLFLEVHGKRPDGFHELETVMVSVRIYDTLCFTEDHSAKICLEHITAIPQILDDNFSDLFPKGKENLIVRAAELLRSRAGIERGVRIRLHKRIPVSAGLAGGSSDAAATLAALNRLWGLKFSVSELQQLASELGSDVGFFLEKSSAAVCRGRGEIVEPLNLPAGLHFVIVRPRTGLSTAEVYRECRPADKPKDVQSIISCLKKGRIGEIACRLHNALQSAAEQLNPEVTQLRRIFDSQPIPGHMMSGSGSAYFGICSSLRQARRMGSRFRSAQMGVTFVAQSGP